MFTSFSRKSAQVDAFPRGTGAGRAPMGSGTAPFAARAELPVPLPDGREFRRWLRLVPVQTQTP